AGDDPVAADVLLSDPDAADDAATAEPLASLDQLHHRRLLAEHDVVTPEHGEGLIADEPACLEDSVPVPLGLGLENGLHLGEPLGALQQLEIFGAHVGRETGLDAWIRFEVRLDPLLTRPDDQDDTLDPGLGHLGDHDLDHRCVDDGDELFRHGAADREEARAESGCWDDAVPHRLDRRCSPVVLARHRRSAATLNGTGCVVRTAKPVTASSGARRSPEVSRSRSSVPASTLRRSTVVPFAVKRRTCTRKRCATTFVDRTKPSAFQPLSLSASSFRTPVIVMSSIARP